MVLRNALPALLALGVSLLLFAAAAPANEFDDEIERIDEALRKNPQHVVPAALDSCLRQRNHALRLYRIGQRARADRGLAYCRQLLKLSEKTVHDAKQPTLAEVQAAAAKEIEGALALEPDLDRGLEIYRTCAQCHTPEGKGLPGTVPQIAGQHRAVVIKQLADIRAGNRESVVMAPYAAVEVIGGVQAVADVAGYIDTLEISTDVDHGFGDDLELGAKLYEKNCARCHGAQGEGDAEELVPRIQSQHFGYMLRQFEDIQAGRRRNANEEMRKQIEDFDEKQMRAVLDYASRLAPPEELQAPPGWKNPDFAQ